MVDPERESRDDAGERESDWSRLMARAQGGDREAYRQLLQSMTPYLRALAGRHHRSRADVEDTVQDVLLTVHAVRHTYDPRRPFGPWLVAIARRRVVDRLRRQGRIGAREAPYDGHETDVEAPANLNSDPAMRERLAAAIDELPSRQREAILLLKIHDMTLKEAAAATGLSTTALKVSVHRGIRKLRLLLGG